MELVANRMMVCALAALLSAGASGPAAAQMADTAAASDTAHAVKVETVKHTVHRTQAPTNPPAARAETRGRVPSAGAVWVAGFWDLRGDPNSAARAGWVWVPGRWIEPPVPDARWDPGHWGWSDDWYTWIPAHWVVPGRHGYPPELQSDQSTELEMSAP
jgi:hypothetical protein